VTEAWWTPPLGFTELRRLAEALRRRDHAEHARGSLGAPFFRVVEPENDADGDR
jgi:hypothetical protein